MSPRRRLACGQLKDVIMEVDEHWCPKERARGDARDDHVVVYLSTRPAGPDDRRSGGETARVVPDGDVGRVLRLKAVELVAAAREREPDLLQAGLVALVVFVSFLILLRILAGIFGAAIIRAAFPL